MESVFLKPTSPVALCQLLFAFLLSNSVFLCCQILFLCPLFDLHTCSDILDDEADDVIHMGHAIMTFYSALIDLLGRCAPEMHVRWTIIIE